MGSMKRLLKPPEAQCPHCRGRNLSWGGNLLGGGANLLSARLLLQVAPRLVRVRLRCADCKKSFEHVHAVDRIVVGYHACHRDFARELVAGQVSVEEWKLSQNDYDWLGEGVYFWEHAPGRAWQWARERFKDAGAVVAAAIRLGDCLDLADTAFTGLLRRAYEDTVRIYASQGLPLPKNGGTGLKLRRLDRIVIDILTKSTDRPGGVHYQTVRCPFEEGEPVYPGAMIRTQSHIQIAVRDRSCIATRVYVVGSEGE